MSMATSNREKFAFKNTLLCLLKALEGKVTTVELRNESSIRGKIITVDSGMNLTMEKVKFTLGNKSPKFFTIFFVQGIMIRFVHIPDDINIKKAIESEVTSSQRHHLKATSARLHANTKRMEKSRKFQAKEDKKKATTTAELKIRIEKCQEIEKTPRLQTYPDVL